MVAFRRRMQGAFGLRLREEIHAAPMINKPGRLARIKRNDRLSILRFFADELALMPHLNIINVVVDKTNKNSNHDIAIIAWKALIQRFSNTITSSNFSGPMNSDEIDQLIEKDSSHQQLELVLA